MSEPEDIVGKADAFLGRYRQTGTSELPVLTDVVDAGPTTAGAASKPPAGQSSGPSEAELRGIEREVTQRVLEAIQPALSGFLEQALRGALQQRVEQAIGTLSEQCKTEVDAIVREAVAKTVEREIDRLRQPRSGGR